MLTNCGSLLTDNGSLMPVTFDTPPSRTHVAPPASPSSNKQPGDEKMEARGPSLRRRIVNFALMVQGILLLLHFFVYETWVTLWGAPHGRGLLAFRIALGLLAVSFVPATLLSHRYFNGPVRWLLRLASIWLGTFNFLFIAALASWLVYGVVWLTRLPVSSHSIAGLFFGIAVIASLYGIANASSIRVRRITVKLPGLPASWRGRVAALVTDTHLGHIKGYRFLTRLVGMLRQLKADVVFISGDLFDGTKVDARRLVSPFKQLRPPFGSYFVTGNHEEFSDPRKYLEAIEGSGIRVLRNEIVNLDGLQVVGVPYLDTNDSRHFQSVLEKVHVDRDRASVLLAHVPHKLPIAEKEGISLQLSGHTHGGQLFPFTWFTSRIFGDYTYGLKKFRDMLVYTSSGVGTWGPPMRVCTHPEIVLISFE
ncbi:MAG TPA: metallophosphoesterase [Candidatus Eremiobacteraceae bacterium]|nr:metallophosphoesterase [Candidatus Eremiobacteraceae bacterium]